MEAKNELGYKALFGGLIFLLSFISGAVPQIFVGLFERHKNFIGIANAFGGGVFLATAFIHMLPELIHDIEQLNVGSQEYPTGFLLVLVGYLALLCLERVAFTHSHHHDEHHHHHGDQFYKIKHHPHHHPEHHNPELDVPTPLPAADEQSPLVKNKHDHTTKGVPPTNPGVNSHQHTHEHPSSSVSKLTPILLLAVLSVHSLFEGLVLGVQENRSDVLAISSAILSHKWVESLSLGLVSIKARASGKFAIFIVALFSFITPLGTLIGYLISNEVQDSIVSVVFNAIALGSFLYIGATEVVGDEFHDVKKKRIRWTKFISLILGAALLCFIRLFIGHDH